MIELRVLGPVDVRAADGSTVLSVLAQPKRLALLAYLALSAPGGFQRRDRVLATFWPESDTDRARAALRQAVMHLRRSLGAGVVVNRGDEELGIAAGALDCDAVAFDAALEAGDAARALELYRGDLLDGFHLPETPGFERWLDDARAQLRRRAAAAAWTLADAADVAGDAAAAAYARRAVALADDDEPGVRRLLALLDRLGDRAGAAAAYEAFARRLEETCGLEPSPETQALVATIGSRSAEPELAPAPAPVAPPAGVPAVHAPPTAAARGRRGWRPPLWPAAAAAVLVLLAGGWYAARKGGEAPPLHAGRVVVAPFENRTGDPALDPVGSMAADWVIQGLAANGVGEVVPFTAALASQRYLAGVSGLEDSARRLQALARETGAGTVVSGAYYRQGGQLHFHVQVTRAPDGHVLHALAPVTGDTAAVVQAVERIRDRILAVLAPLGDARGTHGRYAGVPPTFPAYRAYVQGFEAFVGQDVPAALAHFRRASDADPGHPLPAIASAIMHYNLGDDAAADSIVRSIDRSDVRLGPFEAASRDLVDAWLRGDHAGALEISRSASRQAPGTILEYQVGQQARMINRPREAVRALERLGPERGELRGFFGYWRELTLAHHMLGRHRAELREAERARAIHSERPEALLLEVRALAARGRMEEVEARIRARLLLPEPGWPSAGRLLLTAGDELRTHGWEREARAMYGRAAAWLDARTGDGPTAAAHRRDLAYARYASGDWDAAARAYAALAAEAPDDLALRGRLGTVAARRGDHAAARATASALADDREPYRRGAAHLWRARIAAILGERDVAVALLAEAIGRGVHFGPELHTDPDLALLRDHPPYRSLVRPRD
jgi:DNA-binding SARP family transcriptional activator/TolB-like protein